MVKITFGNASIEKEALGKTSLEEKLFPLWEEARIEGKLPTFPQKKGAYFLKEVTSPYKAIYIHKNSQKEVEVDMRKSFPEKWKIVPIASNWMPKEQTSSVDDKYYLHENTSGWWD